MSRRPVRLPVEDPKEKGLVTIRFLGAARTTTGSLHRVRTPHGDFLLDCGMYQGHRREAADWNRKPPLDVNRLKSVLLSHGHISTGAVLRHWRGCRDPSPKSDQNGQNLPA